MSVVLAGLGRLDRAVEAAIVDRLLAQEDEVRVVCGFRPSGIDPRAHVASGDLSDPDLTYRAAQGARTVVLSDHDDRAALAVMEGASDAGVSRLVVLSAGETGSAPMPPETGWIALRIPRSRLRKRILLRPEDVALAVDAADDLSGDVCFTADLSTAAGWKALGLEPPEVGG